MKAIALLLAAEAGTAVAHSIRSATADVQATQLISKSLTALGGEAALDKINGVTYHSPYIYRSRSLMEGYNTLRADTAIAVGGQQNLSFSFTSPAVQQRIDRIAKLGDFWLFGNPADDALDFSLVVQGGSDGFACYVKGNSYVYDPVDVVGGYTDGALADYLVHQADTFNPKLMTVIKNNNVATASMVNFPGGISLPAVYDRVMNVTVIFDPSTHLPYVIRSLEDHAVFGLSYRDVVLYNYTTVAGVQFPRRIKTMYNHDNLLEDFIITDIDVNPPFSPDFFLGLNASLSATPKTAPARAEGYTHAEIGHFSSNLIWGGEYTGTLANLSATNPEPTLPNVWFLQFKDSPFYAQIVMEFEGGVIVGDAPPHQTQLVIQWINTTLKKPITHIWPTHHHYDHTYAVAEYVAIGAKIITPKVAASYWSNIPGAQLVTFDDKNPFIFKDSSLQARFHWSKEGVHANDYSYATVTKSQPKKGDATVVFEADVWSPGLVTFEWNQAWALDWIRQIAADGVAKNATVCPAHGYPTPLPELLELTGYDYPDYTVCDIRSGPPIC